MSRDVLALFVVLVLVVAGAIALVPATLPGTKTAPAWGEDAAFADRVRSYLMAHPEVIMEAVQLLEQRQGMAQTAYRQDALFAHAEVIRSGRGLPVSGNPDGDVTVVEFFDYRCPFCKRAVEPVTALLEKDRGVRLVHKEFPILGLQSVLAARAAIAANAQGKYLELHKALMAHQGDFSEETIFAIAREAGVDTDRLQLDMQDPAVEELIRETLDVARRLGINGTPAYVVGDEVAVGFTDLGTLQQLVAGARERCETC